MVFSIVQQKREKMEKDILLPFFPTQELEFPTQELEFPTQELEGLVGRVPSWMAKVSHLAMDQSV